jgi:hypothetical protein
LDVEKVLDLINNSDTLVLCFAADQLLDYCDGKADRATEMCYRKYNQLLTRHRNSHEQPTPVVIAVTKADIFPSRPERDRAIAEIQQRILHPLFVPGGKWLAMLAFVTLGRNLGRLTETTTTVDPDKIRPLCIQSPLLFAIHAALTIRFEAVLGQQRDVSRSLDAARARNLSLEASLLRRIFDRSSITQSRDEARRLETALGVSEEEQKRLLDLKEKVKQELVSTKCEPLFFFDGKEYDF